MNEAQYKDIFKDPETLKNLKSKSVTSRERMLSNEKLMKVLMRSQELIFGLMEKRLIQHALEHYP